MIKVLFLNVMSWLNLSKNLVSEEKKLSLWARHHTVEGYRNALELRMLKRVERDVINGNINKAISRCEGFFKYYSINQEIHFKVAELYIQKGDEVKAGQHLFFKENPSEREIQYVREFEKSCGNSPTIVLKKIMPKENYRLEELNNYTKFKLKNFIVKSSTEIGVTPNFLKGAKRYLDKIRLIIFAIHYFAITNYYRRIFNPYFLI